MYCGDLPASLVDGQTSWVYPSIPVKPLYISCYVTDNKLVLLYLSLCLLPQWWPQPGCTLCTVHCTSVHCASVHSHVGIHITALSFAFVSNVFVSILQCALRWLQLSKRFLLTISLWNLQTFTLFSLLEVGCSYHSTQFWTRLFLLLIFFVYCCLLSAWK